MKRNMLPMQIVIVVTTLCLFPLTTYSQSPLLTPAQMPNAINYLPAPPDSASAAFHYDMAQYQWGKQQRLNTQRSAVAVGDAAWSVDNICAIYEKVLGVRISPENTPAIYRMLYVGLMTTDQAGKLAKEHYMRTRPYVHYNEPTIVPDDEEDLRHNGSYPSGHTILGWSAALLLTELAPEYANAILARGYMYGESRVIAGFHWQSDVDAGRLVASAAVARIHADKRFQRLMKKARKEYRKLQKKHLL